MYGILWTRGNECKLGLTGSYATLDVYLEGQFTQSMYWAAGFKPQIVSVHREDGKWVY